MRLDQPLADAQAQAQPVLLAADERLEQALPDGGGDAWAGVAHAQLDRARCRGRRSTSTRTVPPCGRASRAFSSRLTTTCWTCSASISRSNGAGGRSAPEGDLLPPRPAFDQRQGPADDRDQVGRAPLRARRPREVEERLDALLHAADLVLDDGQVGGGQAGRA